RRGDGAAGAARRPRGPGGAVHALPADRAAGHDAAVGAGGLPRRVSAPRGDGLRPRPRRRAPGRRLPPPGGGPPARTPAAPPPRPRRPRRTPPRRRTDRLPFPPPPRG